MKSPSYPRQNKEKKSIGPPQPDPAPSEVDTVEEASRESFPASDSPAWKIDKGDTKPGQRGK